MQLYIQSAYVRTKDSEPYRHKTKKDSFLRDCVQSQSWKADQDTRIKERPRKTEAFSLGALGYIQTWLETPKGGMNSQLSYTRLMFTNKI